MRINEENEAKQHKLHHLARGRHLNASAFAVPSLACCGHVFGDDADLTLQRQGSKSLKRARKEGETEKEVCQREAQAACVGCTGWP